MFPCWLPAAAAAAAAAAKNWSCTNLVWSAPPTTEECRTVCVLLVHYVSSKEGPLDGKCPGDDSWLPHHPLHGTTDSRTELVNCVPKTTYIEEKWARSIWVVSRNLIIPRWRLARSQSVRRWGQNGNFRERALQSICFLRRLEYCDHHG